MVFDEEAVEMIAGKVDGDARMALNLVETCVLSVKDLPLKQVTVETVQGIMNSRFVKYDKHDEEHYNIISALHKSMVFLFYSSFQSLSHLDYL